MKGILFKPEMIRAIRERRKTQTRRLLNPQPTNLPDGAYLDRYNKTNEFCFWLPDRRMVNSVQGDSKYTCMWHPRYNVGETVYVKEPHYAFGYWYLDGLNPTGSPRWVFKMSDQHPIYFGDEKDLQFPIPSKILHGHDGVGWYARSPMFLPEEAARLFVRFNAVSGQRLQDITMEDAVAEGISQHIAATLGLAVPESEEEFNLTAARHTYTRLWDSINATPQKIVTPTHKPIIVLHHTWQDNDWVWKYGFDWLADKKA